VYRNEVKGKPHFRGVDYSNVPIRKPGIHIQINVRDFIMNLFSYGFCEFNCVEN